MRFAVRILLASIGISAAGFSQVTIGAVTDVASYGPRVAPGSLAAIFGSDLASSTASAASTPLPDNLGGASVTVNGTSAPLIYASPGQIDFQVPSSVAAGQAQVIVTNGSASSAVFYVTVLAQAPGILQYGANHAVAQNGDSAHTLNSSNAPAAAGSVITAYLVGQGSVDNAVPDGTPTPTAPLSTATASSSATIGLQNAAITFLGLTPGYAGLAQANITVPALPTGDYPLTIVIGGITSSSVVVSVSGSGAAYTPPLSLTGSVGFSNGAVSGVLLYGNTAYVCSANRITMVDVTNPAKPVVLGEFGDSTLNGNGTKCSLNNSVTDPYLVDLVGPSTSDASFAVWSLSNPLSPSLLGVTATTRADVVNLSFYGNYGYSSTNYITYYTSNHDVVAQNGDFLSWDFTNPASPAYLGMVTPNSAQPASNDLNLKPYAAVVGPITAYAATTTATGTSTAGTGELTVIDLSSPYLPQAVGQVAALPAAILTSFDVSGTTLLAAGNSQGQRNPGNPDFDYLGDLTLTTMDIAAIEAPVVLASFNTGLQVNGTFYTAGFANGVFAIVNGAPSTDDGGPTSLMIVDARNPSNPVLYPFQTQYGFSGIVPTSGGYLLAATLYGLNIYQLQLP